MRRLLAATAISLAVLAAALAACGSGGDADRTERKNAGNPRPAPVAAKKASKLPNVIFIYTDDQNFADFTPETMPKTHQLLARKGTTFSDFVVATPLCCPSRVSALTGDYPHGTGVFSNRGGYRFIGDKFNTLPVWMHNAGYRTAWIGKYIQAYDLYEDDPYGTPGPGIDIWHATFEARYYDYAISDGKRKQHQAGHPRNYYTSVITDYATQTIRKQAKRERPLYMTVNNLAPHFGTGQGGRCSDVVVPAPRDEKAYAGEKVPRTAAYNEADISDKPPFVPDKAMTKEKVEKLDRAYGCRLASLRGVDRSVADIYDAVKRSGELKDTLFVFTSDNGILQGQHRLGGKNVPYEEGIHMPLVMLAGKNVLPGKSVSKVNELTANIDLAPTILELAKAKPCARPGNCRKMDGRSLVPLLKGGGRKAFANREILIEGGKTRGDCLYAGVRTKDLVYLEHAEATASGCNRDAETELYDLTGKLTGDADPGQLENLTSRVVPASNNADVRQEAERLSRRTKQLRGCDGKSCR
jgi:arylsulfatase A-like enzyme